MEPGGRGPPQTLTNQIPGGPVLTQDMGDHRGPGVEEEEVCVKLISQAFQEFDVWN